MTLSRTTKLIASVVFKQYLNQSQSLPSVIYVCFSLQRALDQRMNRRRFHGHNVVRAAESKRDIDVYQQGKIMLTARH